MREILRDEVDLDRPLCLEELRLTNHIRQGERAMAPPHEWYRAEGAAVIAPLAHLEIPDVRETAREHTHTGMHRGYVVDQPALVELRDEPIHLRRAEKEIDFGKGVRQLLLVALHHAADADHGAAASGFLEPSRLDQRVDRFLLGRVDESAGVDDDDLGFVDVGRELRAIVRELSDVALA